LPVEPGSLQFLESTLFFLHGLTADFSVP
jgi:hypothetical protein